MSKLFVNEIASKTGGTNAMSIDTSGKIKPTASGSVVAIRHYSNNTRTPVTGGASGILWLSLIHI